ncbi:MAG: cache domain-containing protein, partial [Anaerolineae bacterium]
MNFLNFLTRLKGWFDTRYSLRKALFWSFVSVIFVPMLLVGSIVAYASINDSRQSAESKLEAVSSLKEAAITRWTEGMMGRLTESGTLDIAARTLYEFDRRPAFVEHLVSRFRLDIMAIRGNSADFDVISLMDLSGNVKASTNLDEVGKTYRDRPFFAYGKSAPYIQPIFYDSQTQAAVLYLSTPVTASTGEVVGVLAGKANLSVLQAILQETTGLGRGSETYLATQDRLILTPVLERRDRVRLSVGMQEGFRGHAGARLYTNYAGAPVVGAYRPLPGLGAVLLAEQGQQYAFAALRR